MTSQYHFVPNVDVKTLYQLQVKHAVTGKWTPVSAFLLTSNSFISEHTVVNAERLLASIGLETKRITKEEGA